MPTREDNMARPDFTQSRDMRTALRGVREMKEGEDYAPDDDISQAAHYFYQREKEALGLSAPLQLSTFARRKHKTPIWARGVLVIIGLILATVFFNHK